MKQKYLVTNIDQTVQRFLDENGQSRWLSPGESTITTRPPTSCDNYTWKIEKLLSEVETIMNEPISKSEKLKGEKKQLNKMEVKK